MIISFYTHNTGSMLAIVLVKRYSKTKTYVWDVETMCFRHLSIVFNFLIPHDLTVIPCDVQ